MQAVGLKTYIWNNNFRSLLLLAGFPVMLVALVWALQLGLMGMGYLPHGQSISEDEALSTQWLIASAPLAIIVAVVWYVIAYFGYQPIIDATTGAHRVSRQEAPELWNLLENLCISRGLTMPDLRIAETDAMNSWASGLSDKRAVITVTRGLLNTLNRDELEAVLGHELTHLINRDSRLMVIAAIFAGVITLICELFARVLFYAPRGRSSRDEGKGAGVLILIGLAAAVFGYVMAIVIRMALSRRREFMADAGSVELTKNPDAMISALQKISGHSGIHAPNDIQALFIDNHEEGFAGLFDTHPPIDQRIAALVKYAHGHVSDDATASATAPMVSAPAPHVETAVPPTPSHADTSVPTTD